MRASIVRIGNSQGVRLPRLLLEQAGITSKSVTVTVEDHRIVIAPHQHPRQNWAEALDAVAQGGVDEDDPALDAYPPTQFDQVEWTWY